MKGNEMLLTNCNILFVLRLQFHKKDSSKLHPDYLDVELLKLFS